MVTSVSWVSPLLGSAPRALVLSLHGAFPTGYGQAGGDKGKAWERTVLQPALMPTSHLLSPQEQRPAPARMPLEFLPQPPPVHPEAPTASQDAPGDPAGSTELGQGTRQHGIWPQPAAAAGEPLCCTPRPPRPTLLSSGNWPLMGTPVADVGSKTSEPPSRQGTS